MLFKSWQRRSKIIVDKRFQWGSTLVGLLYILGIALFVTIPFVYLLRATHGLLAGSSEELTGSFARLQTVTTLAFCAFLVLISMAWIQFSLRRSHKIAGPIINIARIIDEFSKGNFSVTVNLRKHDELKAIAGSLNRMAEKLQARERTLNKRLHDRIQAAKEEVLKSSSLENMQSILEKLQDEVAGVLDQKRDVGPKPEKILEAHRTEETNPENRADELLFK
jgi:HAMP domain-containing protein